MVQQEKFCVHCGQPLNPGGGVFCQSCGTSIANQSASVAYPPASVSQSGQMPAYQKTQLRKKPNFLLILVGILMILAGLIQPAAHLFGQNATASITKVDRRVDSSSEKMDYNYQIGYAFSVDGKQYNGNYHMNKVYNVSKLPKIGSSLPIKYIALMPGFNSPADQGNPFLFLLIVSGLGILLLIIGVKGQVAIRKTKA
jgi:hypothetical protein